MANQELQNYVNQSRIAGASDEQIKQVLLQQGWTEDDINSVLEKKIVLNKSSNKPLSFLRVLILLLIYTIVFFCTFYNAPSNNPHGIVVPFTMFYELYFILILGIYKWRSVSSSFYKQLLRVAGVLAVIDIAALFVPAGFVSLGAVFVGFEIYAIYIVIASLVIFYLTKFLAERSTLLIWLNIIFFVSFIFFMYININYLATPRIRVVNDSMFKTVEDCSVYIFQDRINDCKKDWTTLREQQEADNKRIDLLQELNNNVNLNSNLQPVPESDNYQYFPPENISDVKIGNGMVAKYNDFATVNILDATIRGKIYDPSKTLNFGGPPWYLNNKIELNTKVEGYESYALGVIGMKVGGVRKITFKSGEYGFLFSRDISVQGQESVVYTVELVSLEPSI